MKTHRLFSTLILFIISFISIAINACDSDSGGEVDPVFIPPLTTVWINNQNNNNRFTFTMSSPNSNVGFFTGYEGTVGDVKTYRFIGSYNNRHIEFTYDPSPASGGYSSKLGKYEGTLIGEVNNLKMELASPTLGNLVLKK